MAAMARAGRPSTPPPSQLTPANLAIVEQRHATTNFDSIREYLARQSTTIYSPRAPSLSPMVHSQDRILALQQLEVGSNTRDVSLEHSNAHEKPMLQLARPRSPGLANAMKTKDGRKRHSTEDEVAERLEHRKQRRREKRLIVQDRCRPLSARLRSEEKRKSKTKGKGKGSYTTSKAQRVLTLAGNGYKPLTKMTTERLTVPPQVGMFSRATASVPVALLESSLANRTAPTSTRRHRAPSCDGSSSSDSSDEENIDIRKHTKTSSSCTVPAEPHQVTRHTMPQLNEESPTQANHSIWLAQMQEQSMLTHEQPLEGQRFPPQPLERHKYRSLSPTLTPAPSQSPCSARDELCSLADQPPFNFGSFAMPRSTSVPSRISAPFSTAGDGIWSPTAHSDNFLRPVEQASPSLSTTLSQCHHSEPYATAQRPSMFATSYSSSSHVSQYQLYSTADIRQPQSMYCDDHDDDECSSQDGMSVVSHDASSQTAMDELDLLRPSLQNHDDRGEELSNEMDDLSLLYDETQTTSDELDLLHDVEQPPAVSVFGYPAHVALRWAEDCGASSCATSVDPLDCL